MNIKLAEAIITWQGEGIDSGKRMLLLRFKNCNRSCWYCDTKIRMRNIIESEYDIYDIQKTITDNKLGLMITGGEPSFASNFHTTVFLLNNLTYPFANIETNGHELHALVSKINSEKQDFIKYIYSPKIFTEYDLVKEVERTKLISKFQNVFIKLVYTDNDYEKNYLNEIKGIVDIKNRIYLMPEGTTTEALIKNSPYVFDACEEYGVNFTSRDHIIYGFI